MKITDLLKPQSILLNASPTNKADAIYTLGDLMDKGGNLSDKAEYLEAVFRPRRIRFYWPWRRYRHTTCEISRCKGSWPCCYGRS